MAGELLDRSPRFAQYIGVLRDGREESLGRLDVVQPALVMVMIALAKLWRDCGVEPAAVAEAHLAPLGDRVSLAGINGPSLSVVSGDSAALGELLANFAGQGIAAQRIAVDYAAHSAQIDALRDELLESFALIAPQETVDSVRGGEGATVLGSLRRDDGDAPRFALSLAQVHSVGTSVGWDKFFAGAAAGLLETSHPLLGAAIEDPEGQGLTFVSRLSLQAHPWLADHRADGIALLPGAALLELALAVGEEAGCGTVEELTLEAPLVLPEQGGVRLQVSLGTPGERGERELAIHSTAAIAGPGEWTCHARGVLGTGSGGAAPGDPPASWPPEGAEPVDLEATYDRFAAAGIDHGPAFQGLTAAWRLDGEVFAEVALAPDQAREAKRFASTRRCSTPPCREPPSWWGAAKSRCCPLLGAAPASESPAPTRCACGCAWGRTASDSAPSTARVTSSWRWTRSLVGRLTSSSSATPPASIRSATSSGRPSRLRSRPPPHFRRPARPPPRSSSTARLAKLVGIRSRLPTRAPSVPLPGSRSGSRRTPAGSRDCRS